MDQESSPSTVSNIKELRYLSRLALSLRNRQFRWLVASNTVFGAGTIMTMLADGWLVLTLTDSPLWVGATAGMNGLGLMSFGLFGGVFLDRMDRRQALIAAQASTGAAVFILGILSVGGWIQLWHILLIAAVRGMGMGIAAPAINTLAYDVTGRNRLLNAIALLGAAMTISDIAGGLAAGTLIARAGVGPCYLTAGGCFTTALLLAAAIGHVPRVQTSQDAVWRTALAGLRYVTAHTSLRSLLLMSLLMEMFGFSYFIMLPVVARDVLGVGASGLGYLAAAGGIGALAGSITIASLGDFRAKGLLITLAGGASGAALVLFAMSPWFALSLAMATVIGAIFFTYDASMATLIQLVSSEKMRGRVLGLYSTTWGFTPVGGFISGGIATALGAPAAIGLGGGLILAYLVPASRHLRTIKEPTATSDKAARTG